MKLLVILALLLAVTSAQFSRSRSSRRGGRFRLDSDEFFDDDDDFDDFDDDDRFDRDSLEDIYEDLFDDDASDRRRAQAALSRLRANGGISGRFRSNFGGISSNRFSNSNSGFRSSNRIGQFNSGFTNRNTNRFNTNSNRFNSNTNRFNSNANRFNSNRFGSSSSSNRFNGNSNNRFGSTSFQQPRTQFTASRNPFTSRLSNTRSNTNSFNNIRTTSQSRPSFSNSGFRSNVLSNQRSVGNTGRSTGSFNRFRSSVPQKTRTSRFVPRSTNNIVSNSIDTSNRKTSSSASRFKSKSVGGLKSANSINWPGGNGYFFRMSTGGSKPVSYFIKYDD